MNFKITGPSNLKIFLNYGINKKTLFKSFKKLGVNLNLRPTFLFLKKKQKAKINAVLKKNLVGKVLKIRNQEIDNFYKKILPQKNKH